MDRLDFKQKYIKYKLKYLKLKNQFGGDIPEALKPYIIMGDTEYIIYLNKANLLNIGNITIPEYYQLQEYDGDCQLISVNNFLQKHEYSHLNLYAYLNLFYDNFENIVRIIQQIKNAWDTARKQFLEKSSMEKYDGLTHNFILLFGFIISNQYEKFKKFNQESKDERIKLMFGNIYNYTNIKPRVFSLNNGDFLTYEILMLLMFRKSDNGLFFQPFGNFQGIIEYKNINLKEFIDPLIKTRTKISYPIINGDKQRSHSTVNYLSPTHWYKQEHYLKNIDLQANLDINSFFKLINPIKVDYMCDYTFLLNDDIYFISNINDIVLNNIYFLYYEFFCNLSKYINKDINKDINDLDINDFEYDSDGSDDRNESENSIKE